MKILTAIMTHSGSQKNADACSETWIKDITEPHDYLFYGDQKQSETMDKTWNCTPKHGESRHRLAEKSYKMLVKSLKLEWDFLFKCDDDTFVVFDKLINLLEGYNPNDDLYIGFPLGQKGIKYAQGGSGYVLTRSAVKKYIDVFEFNKTSINKFPHPFGRSEDFSMGFSLNYQNVNLIPTKLLSTPSPRSARRDQSVCIDAIIKGGKITTHYVKSQTMYAIYEARNKLKI